MHASPPAVSTASATRLGFADAIRGAQAWADRRRAVAALLAAILLVAWVAGFVITRDTANAWGLDFHVYWETTQRWLAGGAFYEPWEVGGSFDLNGGRLAVLMPPSFVLIALPFTLLPGALASELWVVIPVLVIAGALLWMRPAPWSWPLIALLIAYPWTGLLVATGNPAVGLTAVLAVGLASRHRWLAAFVLLKPTLAPFALVGLRHRSWWIAVAGLTAASLTLGPLWVDWLKVVVNAHGGSLLYSLPHVPVMAIPVLAWLASEKRASAGMLTDGKGPLDTSEGSAGATFGA